MKLIYDKATGSIDAADMKVGQLGIITGGASGCLGHIVLMTWDKRLISLTNPNSTWSGLSSEALVVTLLAPGERVILEQE